MRLLPRVLLGQDLALLQTSQVDRFLPGKVFSPLSQPLFVDNKPKALSPRFEVRGEPASAFSLALVSHLLLQLAV